MNKKALAITDNISHILDSLPNNVVIFAGDLGCTEKVSSYMYYNDNNITLIASGMGGGKKDNIIVVEVNDDHELNYRLIGLNNGLFSEMAILEDYELP